MGKITIAISGMPGAGSSSVAKLLASKMGLSFFSMGRLFKDISSGTVKKQSYYPLFKNLCDKKNLEIPDFSAKNDSEAVVNLWNSDFGKSKVFHEIIDRLQIELAKRGGIVIDGKLALRMIPEANLKIWIKAELEKRIGRAVSRDKISPEDAKKILAEREVREREEWKRIYGFDYFSQEKDADIVIDASDLSFEQIVEIIMESPELK